MQQGLKIWQPIAWLVPPIFKPTAEVEENVAGGQGTELTTFNQIPAMLVLPLRGTK